MRSKKNKEIKDDHNDNDGNESVTFDDDQNKDNEHDESESELSGQGEHREKTPGPPPTSSLTTNNNKVNGSKKRKPNVKATRSVPIETENELGSDDEDDDMPNAQLSDIAETNPKSSGKSNATSNDEQDQINKPKKGKKRRRRNKNTTKKSNDKQEDDADEIQQPRQKKRKLDSPAKEFASSPSPKSKFKSKPRAKKSKHIDTPMPRPKKKGRKIFTPIKTPVRVWYTQFIFEYIMICYINIQRVVKNKKVKVLVDKEWKIGYVSETGIWKLRGDESVEFIRIRFRTYDEDKGKEVTKTKLCSVNSKKFEMVRRTRIWKKASSPKKK